MNGGDGISRVRAPGMVVHGIGGGDHVAMQTVGAPQLWARLCVAMKRPDLASRPALRHAGGAPRELGRAAPDHLRVAGRFKTVESAR